ncbi:peptide-methionine (S)-S-oxide reductase [Vibrio sp. WXL103]|uniref:peptide-methionine (S)-S-oxide reductase n=1 Tax=Vibrio sp. WXL103 TaxID=3450710 RepID=UPI003EC53ECE
MSGTCYWCMEAVFQSLNGVVSATQGWVQASVQSSTYEAVAVIFKPDVIDINALVTVHLHTHHCCSSHRFRRRYPSAVYVTNDDDYQTACRAIEVNQTNFQNEIITQVSMFGDFTPCPQHQQNYYYSHPSRPFSQCKIAPKLSYLLEHFEQCVDPEKKKVMQSILGQK